MSHRAQAGTGFRTPPSTDPLVLSPFLENGNIWSTPPLPTEAPLPSQQHGVDRGIDDLADTAHRPPPGPLGSPWLPGNTASLNPIYSAFYPYLLYVHEHTVLYLITISRSTPLAFALYCIYYTSSLPYLLPIFPADCCICIVPAPYCIHFTYCFA